MKRPALLVSVIVAAMLVSGCAGIKRAWHAFLTPAQAQSETPLQQPDPWVPMNSTWNVHSVPVWPSRGYSTGGQADGLAIVIHELDRVARLVEKVSRMPPDPGEFQVNYVRIQADIGAVRAGLIEALLQPHAAPRNYPPINRDYLE